MDRDQEKLWQRLAKAKSKQLRIKLRNQLAVEYLFLCERIASRFAIKTPPHIEYGDIYSAAYQGLLESITRFQLDRGVRPETYFARRIAGAIFDYLRSVDDVPRSVRLKAKRISQWESSQNRPVTDDEVHAEFGYLLRQPHTISISTPVGDEHNRQKTLAETIARQDNRLDVNDVAYLLRGLDRRERLIVLLYHVEGYTMKQVAAEVDLSESRISQMMGGLLARMRTNAA